MADEKSADSPDQSFVRRHYANAKSEVAKQFTTWIVGLVGGGLAALAIYLAPAMIKDRFQDPKKVLADRGLPWNVNGLYDAISGCGDSDLEAVRLYRAAGMELQRFELWRVLAMNGRENANGSIRCIDVYKGQYAAHRDGMCTRATSREFLPEFMVRNFGISAANFILEAYRNPAKRTYIESFCGSERMRREFPEVYR